MVKRLSSKFTFTQFRKVPFPDKGVWSQWEGGWGLHPPPILPCSKKVAEPGHMAVTISLCAGNGTQTLLTTRPPELPTMLQPSEATAY